MFTSLAHAGSHGGADTGLIHFLTCLDHATLGIAVGVVGIIAVVACFRMRRSKRTQSHE